eukprot:scaffold3698_cov43-Attheya_sp.AAC.1
MSLQTSHNIVSLLDDDDDSLLLQESGLARTSSNTTAATNRKRTADTMMTTTTTPMPTSNRTTTTATTARKKTPAKKAKQQKAFCIIWVCAHGKGGRSSRSSKWKQKNLKIVGVYGSKALAESAKQELMSRHQCCGHGDIVVGPTWEDEIDLIIREAPLFMDEE